MANSTINDNWLTAVKIAFTVAVVCALAVSITAVTLKPLFRANLEAERNVRLASILQTLSTSVGALSPETVETKVVVLSSGEYSDQVDALTFDAEQARNDPGQSIEIPADADVARLKRRAKHAVVYIVRDKRDVAALILPVQGSGYQSTLRGFLALDRDANTVLGLKFYEHGETPGLGARIQDPHWEALWPGKQAFDETGAVRIGVNRPGAHSGGDDTYTVHAISGATRTSGGVNDLLQFWLGDYGFGPYLRRVRAGEA